MYKLTEEGRAYLERGLPEQNLAKLLERPLELQDAKDRVENFNIALQWAKKRGWVRIEKGKLVLTGKPGKLPEEEALQKISRNEKLDNRMTALLLNRKLIEKERETVSKARKLIGREISNLTPELLRTGLWRDVRLRPYNIMARGSRLYPGKRQPYNSFLKAVRQKLVELGFREMTGPIIETEFWNFDALYQAQDHPSRDWAQTYSLRYPKQGSLPNPKIVSQVKQSHENGWKTGSRGWGYTWDPKKASQLMPRAHGTALSARTLSTLKKADIPGKYFAIARCFRPDVVDATHGVEFNQVEGIVVDEYLNFKHLLGILKQFAMEFGEAEKVKFFPDYYPFTEASCQMSIKHPVLGWVEIGGAGTFREELTKPLGVNEPVIAWGLGIDRLAMCKLGIKDIRELFSQDLKWLRNSRIVLR